MGKQKTPYLAKPLAFPNAKKLSDIFDVIRSYSDKSVIVESAYTRWGKLGPYCIYSGQKVPYVSLQVHPTSKVVEHLDGYLVVSDNAGLYFELVDRGDTVLVVVKYNSIIGDRWLALLPAKEVRKYLPKEDC